MSNVLAWTPVPRPAGVTSRPPGDRYRFVELLKSRPGHWAQYKPGMKHSLTSASVLKKDFPGTEVTQRQRLDGGCDIYARWVG